MVAGRYSVDPTRGITIDVPAGWSGCCGGAIILNGEPVPAFAAIGYDDVTNIIVYGDPCRWNGSAVSHPRGAEAIAASIAAQPGRQGTEPRAVTVGDRPGFHVRIRVPADLAIMELADGDLRFVDCDRREFRTYATAEGSVRYHQGPSQIDDLYIVDVGSRTVVFDVTYFEETDVSDRDALKTMVESVRIG
jgi:hypothetical protein